MFTFSEYDMGNSPIVPDQEGSLSFTICTERDFTDQPTATTLTPSDDRVPGGAIDWKKKTMEVGGVAKPLAEVKHKIGGVLIRLTREWKWSSKKYVASHSKMIWTMKCGEESIAVLTRLKKNAFKKDELATLNFLVEVSNEEMVFLILALLYPEIQLTPEEKPPTFKAAAGEAAGEAAVTGAANVTTAAAFNELVACLGDHIKPCAERRVVFIPSFQR